MTKMMKLVLPVAAVAMLGLSACSPSLNNSPSDDGSRDDLSACLQGTWAPDLDQLKADSGLEDQEYTATGTSTLEISATSMIYASDSVLSVQLLAATDGMDGTAVQTSDYTFELGYLLEDDVMTWSEVISAEGTQSTVVNPVDEEPSSPYVVEISEMATTQVGLSAALVCDTDTLTFTPTGSSNASPVVYKRL